MLDLGSALALPEGASRTAALVAWVQSLFAPASEPVLVGGAAVELYTGGAYTTGDLDFVGTVPAAAENALVRSGFRRQGRHWLQETAQIHLEFPSSALRALQRLSRTAARRDVLPEEVERWALLGP